MGAASSDTGVGHRALGGGGTARRPGSRRRTCAPAGAGARVVAPLGGWPGAGALAVAAGPTGWTTAADRRGGGLPGYGRPPPPAAGHPLAVLAAMSGMRRRRLDPGGGGTPPCLPPTPPPPPPPPWPLRVLGALAEKRPAAAAAATASSKLLTPPSLPGISTNASGATGGAAPYAPAPQRSAVRPPS